MPLARTLYSDAIIIEQPVNKCFLRECETQTTGAIIHLNKCAPIRASGSWRDSNQLAGKPDAAPPMPYPSVPEFFAGLNTALHGKVTEGISRP
jgi:hypothetical protein